MPKCPHLHRRHNTLYFRLSVPVRFQSILHVRELTQTLHTQNYKNAIPAAYKLAGEAKTLFLYLDATMTDKNDCGYDLDFLKDALRDFEEPEASGKKGLKHSLFSMMAMAKEKIRTDSERDRREDEHERALEKRELDTYRKLQTVVVNAPTAQQQFEEKVVNSKAPLLSVVFKLYVDQYKGDGSKDGAANKTKIEGFGKQFISYAGENKIDEITQRVVNDFFRLLVKYPGGRGGRTKAFEKMTFLECIEYAEKNNKPLISPMNFESGYKSPANLFFKYLRANHEDYAPAIVVDHLNYKDYGGKRDAGEDKQRALKIFEVDKLINSEVMVSYSEDFKQICKYWLPMIGIFTGARSNEICQLNPQHDIVKDENTGVWYFNLTNEESGVGVDKSHKNESSKRKVPLHSQLIESGLLDYCERIKKAGHDRIFKSWKPKQGKASYYAEEFFRDYLRVVELRDETLKKKVSGMHCLRSTFSTHFVISYVKKGLTKNQAMAKLQLIIGHADGLSDENGKDLSQTDGYVDDEMVEEVTENLIELREIIDILDYGLTFPCA